MISRHMRLPALGTIRGCSGVIQKLLAPRTSVNEAYCGKGGRAPLSERFLNLIEVEWVPAIAGRVRELANKGHSDLLF